MPGAVEVIGYLPDQIVLTGFRITPVVARISAPSFRARITTEVQDASCCRGPSCSTRQARSKCSDP